MKEKVPVAPVAVSVEGDCAAKVFFQARRRGGDQNPSIQPVRRVRSNDCRNSHHNFLVLPVKPFVPRIFPAEGKAELAPSMVALMELCEGVVEEIWTTARPEFPLSSSSDCDGVASRGRVISDHESKVVLAGLNRSFELP